jgi:hypothetical protein
MRGYVVDSLDPVPLRIEQAKQRATMARRAPRTFQGKIPADDGVADAVLLFGPLYHLTDAEDRLKAIGEARRVLRAAGVLLAVAVLRFASALDGIPRGFIRDPFAGNFRRPRRPPAQTSRRKYSQMVQPVVRSYVHCSNPGGKRARTPNKIEPAKQVEPIVLEAFLRSNEAARVVVACLPDQDNVNRIRYKKSPFIPFLRFTVGAGLEIIAKHQGRHSLRAEAVRQSPGFPR